MSSPLFVLLLLLVFMTLTRARSVSTGPEFDIPEIDGYAVGDACGIIYVPAPDPAPAAITTTTMKAATPPPVTRQTPPKKPPPIRPQPAAARPITNSHSNSAARLLHYLLANSRGHVGARFRPIRVQRHGGRSVGSSSSEDSSDES